MKSFATPPQLAFDTMQIDAIEVYQLRFPETDSVLVRLGTGIQSGWGEACLGREPIESAEWAGSVFACVRDFLGPAVRGQSILSGEQLQELLARFQGNGAAKSAIDCAWWDLRVKTHATTLKAMLGGTREPAAPCIAFGTMPTIDDLLRAIEAEQGKDNVILLKFRPGWDEQMLRAVRSVFPSIPLAIDCDGGGQISQRELFYRLDDFMLRWIEQPYPADDLVAHAMLQEQIRTPICLHQSITSLARAEQALDLGSCRMIKIDPAIVGGLTPARAIHDSCHASNMPLATAGRATTTTGIASLESLATLAGFTAPAEIGIPSGAGEGTEITTALLNSAIEHAVI